MTQLTNPDSLREQAKRFEQAARKLKEAAQVLEGLNAGDVSSSNGRKGRLNELMQVLRSGPASATEIQAKLGIPKGTMYSLFKKHKDTFFQSKRGIWALKANC